MPKASRIKKNAPPPAGYDKVSPTLTKLQAKLKQAQVAQSVRTGSSASTKQLSLWPIMQINHQISRYVYDMYYKRKLISRELYDWLLVQSYVNGDLIAKWKKQGYEHLCCVQCIMVQDKNHKNACVCRVPKATLLKNGDEESTKAVECVTCGCRGCASTD
ncbi:Bud site selection protein 31 [Suhomyces tanzawaensis NRRL Y-17324]|uniref:Bud site selection protein 31 n=1 Tax=Suhomyces tanzawaensis NRRL Y-17324 TaxID=984487 RepID=A0A1E4SJ37_9ASCO|nr:Bud site selection protein 31 [Suhomyces tanzawaensis NRRL Y-17324]ODV79508.1 Bud site selection protein 31 [Suhomyces tanzawaensis NRRL Y-17324]